MCENGGGLRCELCDAGPQLLGGHSTLRFKCWCCWRISVLYCGKKSKAWQYSQEFVCPVMIQTIEKWPVWLEIPGRLQDTRVYSFIKYLLITGSDCSAKSYFSIFTAYTFKITSLGITYPLWKNSLVGENKTYKKAVTEIINSLLDSLEYAPLAPEFSLLQITVEDLTVSCWSIHILISSARIHIAGCWKSPSPLELQDWMFHPVTPIKC